MKAYTRAELREAVLRLSPTFDWPGNALVFCFCSNSIGPVLAYLTCLERRLPVVLLDSGLHPDLKRDLLTLYQPEFVVLPCVGDEPPSPVFADQYSPIESSFVTVLRKNSGASRPIHPDLAVLLSTSGTTGSPKLVRLSRRSIFSNAAAIIAALAITPADRAPTSLPIQYSYGLSVLNSHLLAGASVVLTQDSVTSARFWTTFRETGCTCLAGIPYTYEVIARLGLDKLGLPTLNTMTQAGGKLREPLVGEFSERMRERGGRFFVMYGQTEATARIAVLQPGNLPAKLGSIGKPLEGGQLQIEAAGAIVTEPMVQGELIYTGPNVMMGYANSPEDLALGDELQGRLRTGDAGYFDAEGFFFLTGRLSRFGKVFGLRMNLDEVESLFNNLAPSAVVEREDRLFVYCETADAEAFARRAREIAERLRLHPRAFVFRPVERIPRTAKGRPDYGALAAS